MKNSRILMTGGSGLLGRAVVARHPEIHCPSHRDMDITDCQSVCDVLKKYSPSLIIHAAALVGDRPCAADPDKCQRVNVEGTRHIVDYCREKHVRLVYISTDYVFDGKKGLYTETDTPAPISVYSRSKHEGEILAATVADHLVVRGSFHKSGKWKYPTAFMDQYTSRLDVDTFADQLFKASISALTGILHIGGERNSLFAIVSAMDPDVRPASLASYDMQLPVDVSLDSSRWKHYLASLVK